VRRHLIRIALPLQQDHALVWLIYLLDYPPAFPL